MAIEIKAPVFPESVADGTIATWHKKVGDTCARDELLVDIETDKVVLEIVAPLDGIVQEILKQEGDTILSEEPIALMIEGVEAGKPAGGEPTAADEKHEVPEEKEASSLSPAAWKAAETHGVDPATVVGSGKNGRITKEDVVNAAKPAPARTAEIPVPPVKQAPPASPQVTMTPSLQEPAPRIPDAEAPGRAASSSAGQVVLFEDSDERTEKRVPMTRLRAKVAQRLVEAQQTAAMLTTFNEVDMAPVMALRSRNREIFEKRHGVKLGFMSFFVKACVEALKRQPAVNASIDSGDIVYHGYQDIGVAVSSARGLVVPVLRNAENIGLAEIEDQIRQFGKKAKEGKLSIDEMTGGTFTISNGGVFGSLLSTPILNPPQSAILGMHKIQERPVVVEGEIVIRPMMYLALSYDHRLLDGKEAVTFLVTIKELLEDPVRMLLDV